MWVRTTLTLLKDMRWLRLGHYILMLFFGVVLARPLEHSFTLYVNLFCIILSIFFAALFSIITNNIADLEIDKICNQSRPLVVGAISKAKYQSIAKLALILSLMFALTVNFWAFCDISFVITVYYLYSMPPFRFKKILILSKLAISINSLAIIILGYTLAAGSLNDFPFILFPIFLIGFTLAANFIDIKDHEGDASNGIVTLPGYLGVSKSKIFIGLSFFFTYISFISFLPSLRYLWLLIGGGLIQVVLINKKKYEEKAIFLFHLFSIILLICLLTYPDNAGAETIKKESLAATIHAGEKFIIDQTERNNYLLTCVSSDKKACPFHDSGLLVLYYTINALDDKLSPRLRQKILEVVKSERQNNLWGYDVKIPRDLDSSIYALQILTKLGEPQDIQSLAVFYKPERNAYASLISSDKAILATYPSDQNNYGIHPEVSANLYNLFVLLKEDSKINYDVVKQFQTKIGNWDGYFTGKYYSTYVNMALLCKTQHNKSEIQKGIHFILSSQSKDGSWDHDSFNTALALNTLFECKQYPSPVITNGINYLMHAQIQNGVWETKQSIWSFLHVCNSNKWEGHDNHHVLTTAIATMALKKYSAEVY